jgi:hypothetical protein
MELRLLPGVLAWWDGGACRPLAPVVVGLPLSVRLDLDRLVGRATVSLDQPGQPPFVSEPVPWLNLVVDADTLFLDSALPHAPAATCTVVSVATGFGPDRPRPTLHAEALGSALVRLSWTRVAGDAGACRVWRDGAAVATLPAGALGWQDHGVRPRTRYSYEVEVVGGARSRPAVLVTGPENEQPALRSGSYDVVVYGATPGGIAAAVALGRRRWRVALVEPTEALGGLITGGLTRTDFGSVHALGGLFQEFMQAIDGYYAQRYPDTARNQALKRGGLFFEPSAARAVFNAWLGVLPSVSVFRACHVVAAETTHGKLTRAVFEDRRAALRSALTAPVFVDASYEGDLAAAAGCEYLIGRESSEEYGETHAGELWWDVWQRRVVDAVGRGDRRVQAYNYRLCLTRDIDNRRPPPMPLAYRREDYVSLLPDIHAGRLDSLEDILSILPVPNAKFDANNHPQGNPSSDLVGGADDWPEADWRTREVLVRRHRDHLLGLLWFLRSDPEVPESLQRDAQAWGLAADEFPESRGWPSALYVREGRRIVGDFVFTERDAVAATLSERPPAKPDSIAVGAYPIDSHATGDRHPTEPDWLEGFFYLARGETKPYGIPYRAMLPRGVDGLLVVCAVSATHVGFGSLRMEPVFMSLGLAAGMAAELALLRAVAPRQVPSLTLQRELLARSQVLTVYEDIGPRTPGWEAWQLWGAFGGVDSYRAEPRRPLTGADWRTWLECAPWSSCQEAAALAPDEDRPMTLDEWRWSLGTLAARCGQPCPEIRRTPTRGEAMALLGDLLLGNRL